MTDGRWLRDGIGRFVAGVFGRRTATLVSDARRRRRRRCTGSDCCRIDAVVGSAVDNDDGQRVQLVLDHPVADFQPLLQEPIVDGQHAPVLDEHGRMVRVRVPARAADHHGPGRRPSAVVTPRAHAHQRRLHFAQHLFARENTMQYNGNGTRPKLQYGRDELPDRLNNHGLFMYINIYRFRADF